MLQACCLYVVPAIVMLILYRSIIITLSDTITTGGRSSRSFCILMFNQTSSAGRKESRENSPEGATSVNNEQLSKLSLRRHSRSNTNHTRGQQKTNQTEILKVTNASFSSIYYLIMIIRFRSWIHFLRLPVVIS